MEAPFGAKVPKKGRKVNDMKRLKKALALALALTVVMAFSGLSVFAATGDLTVDASISVSGIDKGDKVTVYQFVKWENGNWVVDPDAGITLEELTNGLNAAELGTIASHASEYGDAIANGVAVGDNGTWTLESPAAGSYIVLIQDVNNDTIYNPIVVSADYDPESPNTIALTDNMALAKKEPVTVTKKITGSTKKGNSIAVGDEVPFTVETNVPTYNTNWTDPKFEITDELSTGLTLKAAPTVSVEGYTLAATDYSVSGGAKDSGYTVSFSKAFLQRVTGNPKVTIEYSAIVGEAVKETAQVHEEDNTVTLSFSNNPNSSSDHGTKEDETHHYTFAIDASRFGSTTENTGELIKVGVDKDGNAVEVYKEGDPLPEKTAPLAGAKFTLTGTDNYSQTVTSDGDGKMFFNNLKEGTYTLTETKAPAGYIKDDSSHTVVISAEYNTDGTLKSYSIKIDNQDIATYTATTKADKSLDTINPDPDNKTFPINNTKGTELPTTGGIGTTIFYIVGAILVVGAGILLISRRRMAAK